MNVATRAKNAARSSRVVDRAEDGRRGHRRRRRIVVQVARLDGRALSEAPAGRVDHRRLGVDAAVAKTAVDEERAEAAVPAGEVEHLVAVRERGAERHDQLRAMREICSRVGVLGVGPAGRLVRVLVGLAHNRASVSGWARTKRPMLRACHSV